MTKIFVFCALIFSCAFAHADFFGLFRQSNHSGSPEYHKLVKERKASMEIQIHQRLAVMAAPHGGVASTRFVFSDNTGLSLYALVRFKTKNGISCEFDFGTPIYCNGDDTGKTGCPGNLIAPFGSVCYNNLNQHIYLRPDGSTEYVRY